ncbi:GTP-binding protein [Streptomyces sp. NPDC059009]|uniref:GTP-binding protein n=1 Tax=Streptomyces sp. NPDC059009 TaxID=3346694 RepID=UPI00367E75C1
MPSTPTAPTLNIGVLAHVDAGKTSLTERLLFDAGAIDRLGSVDSGTTRTDTGSIERRRGITIRTAVAPFTARGVQINLIDTPGHSDFIAEVERALGVLDAAVLVLSAVEGVQAQTRVLMKTLRRLGLPALIFVNKTDRPGARTEALLDDIRRKLTPYAAPMTAVHDAGTPAARTVALPLADVAQRQRLAEVLAETDETVLEHLVEGRTPTAGELRRLLSAATARGQLHPVHFGSALSGAGVAELVDGIVELRHGMPTPPLPASPALLASPDLPASPDLRTSPAPHASSAPHASPAPHGVVFAVERGPGGAKTAYLRLYEGKLAARQRVTFWRREADGTRTEESGRVTVLDVVGRDGPLTPGNIARLRGLPGIQVGDRLGGAGEGGEAGTAGEAPDAAEPYFAPPTLETVVHPCDPAQAGRLHAALLALADQDPLIHTRTVPGGATSVLLYGEVQKEIVADTLAEEFGVAARFEPSRTVCVSRPAGVGEAVEEMAFRDRGPSGFWATVGLRVDPLPPGSGVVFRYETELGALPYAFHHAIEETVQQSLRSGPDGWAVTDCQVTLTRSAFVGPLSTAADFRGLTPIVLARALEHAGTQVYEPYHAFEVEAPLDSVAGVGRRLAALGAEIRESSGGRDSGLLSGEIAAHRVHEFEQALPGLSHGEGVWWSRPVGFRPAIAPR